MELNPRPIPIYYSEKWREKNKIFEQIQTHDQKQ